MSDKRISVGDNRTPINEYRKINIVKCKVCGIIVLGGVKMFSTYQDWLQAVESVFNRFNACIGYLNESGERRRSEFGVLMSLAWVFDNATDVLDYIKNDRVYFDRFRTIAPAIRQLEKLAIIEGGNHNDQN